MYLINKSTRLNLREITRRRIWLNAGTDKKGIEDRNHSFFLLHNEPFHRYETRVIIITESFCGNGRITGWQKNSWVWTFADLESRLKCEGKFCDHKSRQFNMSTAASTTGLQTSTLYCFVRLAANHGIVLTMSNKHDRE